MFYIIDMTKRLQTITELVQPGKGIIDVGTDHGIVPVTLARNGYPGAILASDINEAPLSAARRYAEENGVEERICFLLSNGLDGCPRQKVDTVIIAGMGGDLIVSIIDRAEWLKTTRGIRLILQPMTKGEILRYYLVNNGFGVLCEKLVRENGKLFRILVAQYTGVFCQQKVLDITGKRSNEPYTDAELFTGRIRLLIDCPDFPYVVQEEICRMEKKISGLSKSVSEVPKGPEVLFIRKLLKELKVLQERI